jgi:hypothetical protein
MKPVKLVNLTPHAVNILVGETVLTIPPSGKVARVKEVVEDAGFIEVDGVRIPLRVKRLEGKVEDLPAPEEGTFYITSYLAAQAAWNEGRTDVLSVGDHIRDSEGRIVGASSLYINPSLRALRERE